MWSTHFLSLSSIRLEDLRLKLENEGFTNVSFVVVNHQGAHSQKKYAQLREKVSENIPVYQQESTQPDVWTVLNGKKDDFLIYDRSVYKGESEEILTQIEHRFLLY